MGSMGNLKLIAVTPENYWHLKNLGKAGDSFNDVVTRILKDMKKSSSEDETTVSDTLAVVKALNRHLREDNLLIQSNLSYEKV